MSNGCGQQTFYGQTVPPGTTWGSIPNTIRIDPTWLWLSLSRVFKNPGTVRLLIGMFGRDYSGTLSYDEFDHLWKYIMDWKDCFHTYDRGDSGFIDKHQLRDALSRLGYNLSEKFYENLIKYDRHNISTIAFDYFVRSVVILQTLTNFFRAEDKDQDGWIDIAYDNFLNIIFSLRS